MARAARPPDDRGPADGAPVPPGRGGSAPSFEAFAEAYLAQSRRDHSPATARTRRDLVRGKLVPFFRGRALGEIAPADVEALLAAHAGTSPATRNRLLSALSVIFKRARALGLVRRNPAARVPRAREEVTPLPLVSLAEQAALLAALPEERRTLFLALLDTGARLGEVLGVRWGDLDLETPAPALVVRRTKNRRPRVVRLSRRLANALGRARAARAPAPDRAALVFGAAVAHGGWLRGSWRRSFKRAAAAAGHPRLRVHDLRHLAAINLVRAGVDLPTVQAHLGHRHLVSTFRYAAYADETASERAARTLDRIHGEAPGP